MNELREQIEKMVTAHATRLEDCFDVKRKDLVEGFNTGIVNDILSLISQCEQASYEQGKRDGIRDCIDSLDDWYKERDAADYKMVVADIEDYLKAKYSSEQEGKHRVGEHGAVGLVTQNGSICAECHEPIKEQEGKEE